MFFAERGETKLDLVEFYEAVRDPLLAAMGGRPVLLQRFPDGADGQLVLPEAGRRRGRPPWLETTVVSTPNGTTSDALVAADLAHVAWAVNMGCLGFHVWPARADDPDHADELRIDLDPTPGVDFPMVREAALLVRDLLAELGLVGWPKTTGNRGIHVYLRLEPRWDSYEVRAAAVALARELERRHPDLLTAAWWKEERGGRVFVDFNQNAPHKTVFGAWCVRARPGAQVSTPFPGTSSTTRRSTPTSFTIAGRRRPGRRATATRGPGCTSGRSRSSRCWRCRRGTWPPGCMDAPWPPVYPKKPNEPPRVAPSRAKKEK